MWLWNDVFGFSPKKQNRQVVEQQLSLVGLDSAAVRGWSLPRAQKTQGRVIRERREEH